MHVQSFLWAEGARRRPDRRSRRFHSSCPSFLSPQVFFSTSSNFTQPRNSCPEPSLLSARSTLQHALLLRPNLASLRPSSHQVTGLETSPSLDQPFPLVPAPALPPSILPSLLRPTQSAHHDAVARFPQPQLDGSCPRMSEPVSFANPNPRSPLRPPSQPTHLRIQSTDSSDGSSSSPPTLDFFNLTERRGSLRSLHHDPNRNSGGSWNGDLPQSRRGSAVGHALNSKRSGELGWSPNKYVPLLSCQTWRLLCLGADQHPSISARTVLTGPAPQRLQDVHPSPRPSPSTTHRSFL